MAGEVLNGYYYYGEYLANSDPKNVQGCLTAAAKGCAHAALETVLSHKGRELGELKYDQESPWRAGLALAALKLSVTKRESSKFKVYHWYPMPDVAARGVYWGSPSRVADKVRRSLFGDIDDIQLREQVVDRRLYTDIDQAAYNAMHGNITGVEKVLACVAQIGNFTVAEMGKRLGGAVTLPRFEVVSMRTK